MATNSSSIDNVGKSELEHISRLPLDISSRSPKLCVICENPVGPGRSKCCSDICSKERRRRKMAEYNKARREADYEAYLAYHREYRNKNKKNIAIKDKARQEKNREKIKKRKQQHYQKNKDKINARNREYYHNNKEKMQKSNKKWLQSTEGKISKKNSYYKRRATEKRIIETFNRNDAEKLLKNCNGICPSCGKAGEITLDHILPISKAPDWHIYTLDDVQPLCRPCNSRKRDKIIW